MDLAASRRHAPASGLGGALMLVYGDHSRLAAPTDCLATILAEHRDAAAMPAGIERHGRLVGAFILAGELAQGLADHAMARAGHDDRTALGRGSMALVSALADRVIRSWDSGYAAALAPLHAGLAGLPDQVELRTPEGYAFYALYPEAYALAARALPAAPSRVVGLRSIGTGLAAIAAAAIGAPVPDTVRPVGPPFERRLSLSPALAASLGGPGRLVVVDEGPGLSGSSFGAVADFVAGRGSVVCLPSHANGPGTAAAPAHLARWPAIAGPVVTFDELCLGAGRSEHGLAAWFADAIGEVRTLADLSGGAWRAARGLDAPAIPHQERRKFLARTDRGAFLLKFVGLGAIGGAKYARAQSLAEAGFVPKPLGFRHGFMAEPWYADARPLKGPLRGPVPIERIGQYLGWRAANLPATQGASLAALGEMARHNFAEAGVRGDFGFDAGRRVRPVHVDGRLHAWEWLCLSDGRMLKADAVDHSQAHDLVGCQDIAWDIAGAVVEFDLTSEQDVTLRCLVEHQGGSAIDPALLRDYTLYYCGFQIGLWPDRARRYLARAQALGFSEDGRS